MKTWLRFILVKRIGRVLKVLNCFMIGRAYQRFVKSLIYLTIHYLIFSYLLVWQFNSCMQSTWIIQLQFIAISAELLHDRESISEICQESNLFDYTYLVFSYLLFWQFISCMQSTWMIRLQFVALCSI